MNTRFYKYTSLLLAITGLISLESAGQMKTAANNKSLLWEITGKQLKSPVYLYGTIHLICSEDAHLSKELEEVIKKSADIYFEIDLDDPVQLLAGSQLSIMKNDTTIEDLLLPDEYERVQNFFKEKGMAMQFEAVKQIQPMMISALVYQTFLHCEEVEGVEMAIMQKAHQYGKTIKGLETAAYQASLLDKIPYEKQAKELLNTIDHIEEANKEAETLQKLYWQQDVDKLLEQSLKLEKGMSEDVQAFIINERNMAWVNKIASYTDSNIILLAIGAGHLGGENGMLKMLKDKGYSVRAIENNRIKEF